MKVEENYSALPAPATSVRAIVVVPARDEEARIQSCLTGLAGQRGLSPDEYEIILVLDGCLDGTLAAVCDVKAGSNGPPVHLVVLAEPHGVGRARRIGMDLAYERFSQIGRTDGLIASSDADTVVSDNWLSTQLQLVASGVKAIGGLIELDSDEVQTLHPDAVALRDLRAKRRLDHTRARSGPSGVEHPHFSGASLALTASAYRQCGGLPVRAALEDEALADALVNQGIKINYSSLVKVRTSARTDGRVPRGLSQDLARSDWRARRSYRADQFGLESLLRVKDASIALVLPARDVQETIEDIALTAQQLQLAGLFDEVLVVDANSSDETVSVAKRAGVRVVQEDDLMRDHGQALGKGDAMWRGMAATTSDIVVYADTDTKDFNEGFLLGLVGPLLCDPDIQLVKGFFRRPFQSGGTVQAHGGGRVTELMARPLLNLHAPALAVFDQPLAGETAARRSLLEQIPFSVGYGVEVGMLIDAWRRVGLECMAQVDLGVRQNRHQPLRELSAMAYAVLVTAQARLLGPVFADQHACGSLLLPPMEVGDSMMDTRAVPLDERPAMRSIKQLNRD